jgi:hypothetical protein
VNNKKQHSFKKIKQHSFKKIEHPALNLLYGDLAELEKPQRPPREGKLSTRAARAARAACMEKIYEIPRARGRDAPVPPVSSTVCKLTSTGDRSYRFVKL